jgi:hypothetical protein
VPGYSDVYSKQLEALVDADLKAQEPGDSGSIDWDVFVNGNAWEVSKLAITLVPKSATRAQVRARFFYFKGSRTSCLI